MIKRYRSEIQRRIKRQGKEMRGIENKTESPPQRKRRGGARDSLGVGAFMQPKSVMKNVLKRAKGRKQVHHEHEVYRIRI